MKSIINELAVAKMNNKVHNGIRYYVLGETYFCNEFDYACEFPFRRVCVDLPEPEKYIDNNIVVLKKEANEVALELMIDELSSLSKEKELLDAKISHIRSLIGNVRLGKVVFS